MSDADQEIRELAFKTHGMDCAEEVNLLQAEVGPIVGDDDHLSFDLLRGRMKVRLGDGTLAPSVIQEAVSRAGLTAEPWSDEKTPSGEAPQRQRRGRIIATVASGLACAMALASDAFLRGGLGAAIGIERAGGAHDLPAVSIGLYGIAIGCGLFYVAPKAWLAVRRLRFDMNLLMTAASFSTSSTPSKSMCVVPSRQRCRS